MKVKFLFEAGEEQRLPGRWRPESGRLYLTDAAFQKKRSL
jgi:hypothetical protein